MKKLLLALIALEVASCASLPKGGSQLQKIFAADELEQKGERENIPVNKGQPIFIRTWQYPEIYPSGDIDTGGEILIYAGREDFLVDKLLEGEKP